MVSGQIDGEVFRLVAQWIDLNRDVLIAYWEGDIEYTRDLMARLTPLPR